jgi:type II secretory pathway pseudopilin PulG
VTAITGLPVQVTSHIVHSPYHVANMTPDRGQRRARRRVRNGLTLIEIVVAVAIIMILVASLAPSLVGVLDRKRIEGAEETLSSLTAAMSEMRADNQDWPSRLSHLSTAITTADKNICGVTYSSGKVSNWAGPYVARVIQPTGFPIGIGMARDSLVRELVSGTDGYIKIQVDSVTQEDASDLDKLVDNDGSAAGTVRWGSTSATGQVTLFFLRPIRGC